MNYHLFYAYLIQGIIECALHLISVSLNVWDVCYIILFWQISKWRHRKQLNTLGYKIVICRDMGLQLSNLELAY